MKDVSGGDINEKMAEYRTLYDVNVPDEESVRYQAKIECALEKMLAEGGWNAFTTNFEDLTGLEQLPGLAVQNLLAKGYGFAAEGDWKPASRR